MTTPPVPTAGPAASPTPQPVSGASAPERQEHTLTAIRAHHQALGEAVVEGALSVWESVDRLTPGSHQSELVALCEREVLPHAAAEERTLYRAGIDLPAVAPMIRAMLAEHTTLRDAVDRLAAAHSPGRIAGAAGALGALFLSHLDKENDILLPALVDAGVDLAAVLDGMHEILGPAGASHGPTHHTGSGCGCADGADGCGCGNRADTVGDPVGADRGEEPAVGRDR
ncbi:MAG TPA: hemerythrin domain-containing protein [Mycobacteriales bacterium]|nr:hemerythrin domain-containing protein [Mycobacteriales bacterium]